MRADFYPELMACSLWQPIRANRLELTPLGDEELRAAILQPAAQVGVTIDEVLAERLVADAAGESGALPLVQEALVLLWEKVDRRHLALKAYTEMAEGNRNGLQVAIDRRAKTVYNNLPENAQPIARRIFLRLIQFGEGRLDTRRQQTVDELRSASDDARVFDETLAKLTANRLLTTSGEEGSVRRVDIAHEALIQGWGLLRRWIGENREALLFRNNLADAYKRFVESGRDPTQALRGSFLLAAETWYEAQPDLFDMELQSFLEESIRQRDEQERGRKRRERIWIAILTTLFVLSFPAAFVGANLWMFTRRQHASWQLTDFAANSVLSIASTSDGFDNWLMCLGTADIGVGCSQDVVAWNIYQAGLPRTMPALFNNRDSWLGGLTGSRWSTKVQAVESITFDVLDPHRLLISVMDNEGLFESMDGGVHWHRLQPPPSSFPSEKLTAVRELALIGDSILLLRKRLNTLEEAESGALYFSPNRGEKWQQIGGAATATGSIRDMHLLHQNGRNILYVGGENGLFVAEVGQWSWQQLLTAEQPVKAIAWSGSTFYVATYEASGQRGEVYRWSLVSPASKTLWGEYEGDLRSMVATDRPSPSVWLLFNDGRVVALEGDGAVHNKGRRPGWFWSTAKVLALLDRMSEPLAILMGHRDGLLIYCGETPAHPLCP